MCDFIEVLWNFFYQSSKFVEIILDTFLTILRKNYYFFRKNAPRKKKKLCYGDSVPCLRGRLGPQHPPGGGEGGPNTLQWGSAHRPPMLLVWNSNQLAIGRYWQMFLNKVRKYLNPRHSQSTIDSEGFKGGTRGAPIMPRDAVSRTANVERTGRHKWDNWWWKFSSMKNQRCAMFLKRTQK